MAPLAQTCMETVEGDPRWQVLEGAWPEAQAKLRIQWGLQEEAGPRMEGGGPGATQRPGCALPPRGLRLADTSCPQASGSIFL